MCIGNLLLYTFYFLRYLSSFHRIISSPYNRILGFHFQSLRMATSAARQRSASRTNQRQSACPCSVSDTFWVMSFAAASISSICRQVILFACLVIFFFF